MSCRPGGPFGLNHLGSPRIPVPAGQTRQAVHRTILRAALTRRTIRRKPPRRRECAHRSCRVPTVASAKIPSGGLGWPVITARTVGRYRGAGSGRWLTGPWLTGPWPPRVTVRPGAAIRRAARPSVRCPPGPQGRWRPHALPRTVNDQVAGGRGAGWARCIILRSGDIAARNTPAAGRCARVCALVTSEGIGGTEGSGGAVPLCVTSDGIGGTEGFGGAVPLGDGRGGVVAGLGSGWGAAGSGIMSSLGR